MDLFVRENDSYRNSRLISASLYFCYSSGFHVVVHSRGRVMTLRWTCKYPTFHSCDDDADSRYRGLILWAAVKLQLCPRCVYYIAAAFSTNIRIDRNSNRKDTAHFALRLILQKQKLLSRKSTCLPVNLFLKKNVKILNLFQLEIYNIIICELKYVILEIYNIFQW